MKKQKENVDFMGLDELSMTLTSRKCKPIGHISNTMSHLNTAIAKTCISTRKASMK